MDFGWLNTKIMAQISIKDGLSYGLLLIKSEFLRQATRMTSMDMGSSWSLKWPKRNFKHLSYGWSQ